MSNAIKVGATFTHQRATCNFNGQWKPALVTVTRITRDWIYYTVGNGETFIRYKVEPDKFLTETVKQ